MPGIRSRTDTPQTHIRATHPIRDISLPRDTGRHRADTSKDMITSKTRDTPNIPATTRTRDITASAITRHRR